MNKQEIRKEKSIEYLKDLGIDYILNLPVVEDSSEVMLKDVDEIIKRFLASFLAVQLACDVVGKSDFSESKEFFESLLKRYGVSTNLLKNEIDLFNGLCSEKDAVNITWNYEACFSLFWALGFDVDIKDCGNLCDVSIMINEVSTCSNYEEFRSKCILRNVEDILDMVDLFYRFHWACVEYRINPDNTNIGSLNEEIVMERRKGFEWLICNKNDWKDISLDT